MSTRDVILAPSEYPSANFRWRVTPLDNRQTEWFRDEDAALKHARRAAKASGGYVIRRNS